MCGPAASDLPKLAPPGAGLPWLELTGSRFAFGWMSRRATREKSTALLEKECATTLDLARPCDETAGSRRVLIPRLLGMEDSSRYWSVFMTLDHLRIVHHAIAATIRSLGQGKVPERVASTAAVKPSADATASVLREFDLSCAIVNRCARDLPDPVPTLRFSHPWFGPLTAAQWHFLAAIHLQLHRHQVEHILRHLL